MSIITDTFFGGAEKDAAKATQQGIERGILATQAATAQARQDLGELFPQARQDLQGGFQGALDVFKSTVPQQSNIFQQGNIGAQQAILAGLPQMQNAILGNQIDLSGLQPSQQFQPDFGFLNQNIMPEPVAAQDPIQQQQTPAQVSAGGGNLTLDEILGAFGVSQPTQTQPFSGLLNSGTPNTNTLSLGGASGMGGGSTRRNPSIFDFRN